MRSLSRVFATGLNHRHSFYLFKIVSNDLNL